MKELHCPLCGTRHDITQDQVKIVCKCGKTLGIKVSGRTTEIKMPGVKAEDFDG